MMVSITAPPVADAVQSVKDRELSVASAVDLIVSEIAPPEDWAEQCLNSEDETVSV